MGNAGGFGIVGLIDFEVCVASADDGDVFEKKETKRTWMSFELLQLEGVGNG